MNNNQNLNDGNILMGLILGSVFIGAMALLSPSNTVEYSKIYTVVEIIIAFLLVNKIFGGKDIINIKIPSETQTTKPSKATITTTEQTYIPRTAEEIKWTQFLDSCGDNVTKEQMKAKYEEIFGCGNQVNEDWPRF